MMSAPQPPRHSAHLTALLGTHDLHVACDLCCKEEAEITFSLIKPQHQCSGHILLARKKGNTTQWRPVSKLPSFPKPWRYVVCLNFLEGQGCTLHGNRCSYARSCEEAAVWNFLKDTELEHFELVDMLKRRNGSPARRDGSPAESLGAAESILRRFPGTFTELCETCFHASPQQISEQQRAAGLCASRHRWKPTLVLCQQDRRRVAYDEIRPRLQKSWQHWRYCKYVEKGEPCWHGAHRCWFAHSTVEMAVWQAESGGGLARSELLRDAQRQQSRVAVRAQDASRAKSRPQSCQRQQQHYCKVCRCQLPSHEDYMNHCFTEQHKRLISEDMEPEWRHRDPPQMYSAFTLCKRSSTCEYGGQCLEAHSLDELQEWRTRDKAARRKAKAAEEQGLLSYQDRLLGEYRESNDQELIMSETVPGVTINSDSELTISVRKEKVPLRWKFNIQSERALVEVALLKHEPGATFTLGEDSGEVPRTYSTGDWFRSSDASYDITVSFTSICPGLYEQWLVFDFDTRPVLLQKLKVRVGKKPLPRPEGIPDSVRAPAQDLELWHGGSRVTVPYWERTEAEEELLKKYKPLSKLQPQADDSVPINPLNYLEKMHSFLYQEEIMEDKLITRLNLRGPISLSDRLCDPRFGLKFALPGELFAAVSVSYALTPDTPEGFLLKQGVQSVLVCPVSADNHSLQVYEALILPDTASERELHLQLSKTCCADLNLQKDKTYEMEVQFQLRRLQFCEMHKAVDLLPDLEKVLPDFNNSCVPVHRTKDPNLNPRLNVKQQAAMDFMLGASDGRKSVPPLLIYGPFGTGKTYTLATAALELVQQPGNKVLICTHTNSSADLYVREHFHIHVTSGTLKARPLRIKAKEVRLTTTDDITRQYCHLSRDGMFFDFPDKATVDSARIVITTTVMARYFYDLALPAGYFSHILIDEASQMLECEALMALGLAGAGTRVVLAGDHMQMGPKLFSVAEDKRSDHTLLNRLFHYYQAEKNSVASRSRIIFNENYRSTKEIVDFVSTHFYIGKSDVIKASGNVPPHPTHHPLRFHHVRGECCLDTTTMSWFNPSQIGNVVEVVLSLLRDWPAEWVPLDPATICVLSQGRQVFEIRGRLKQLSLRGITVENAQNVQGKQFRAIVISTVHTKDSLKPSDSSCLEFFNDARVLNTAMTRAQSQVVVVGDAAALCYFGKCSRLWKSYIEHCIDKESAQPEHLTKDFVKQEVMEISRFVNTEEDDNSDSESSTSEISDIDDPILRELLDESKDLPVTLTEEGLFPIFQMEKLGSNLDKHERIAAHDPSHLPLQTFSQSSKSAIVGPAFSVLSPHSPGYSPPVAVNPIPSSPLPILLETNPSVYKHCELVMERFDSGYAIPVDEPTLRIDIRGKNNVGHSFPGDQVLVQILSREYNPPRGKVVNVLKPADSANVYVCTLDRHDGQVMTPINKCITKIYTPCWRDKPNHIAVRNLENWKPERFVKINEESKRNHLFVVKVLKWREKCFYPLGVVVKVLPKVTSLEDGLEVLDIEYRLSRTVPESVQNEIDILKADVPADAASRKDFRELTTFTIDPSHSQDLDDAISVRDLGQHYEIGVHISDVASFVGKDSKLDEYAKQQGTAFYPPEEEPAYMFPRILSTEFLSLLPDCDRHAISLMVVVDKRYDRIVKREFSLSVIRSDRNLSYKDAEEILQNSLGSEHHYNTLEGCLAVACHFSEVHRKDRKQEDWGYKTPDEDVIIGCRRSHRMVEELMVMYNHTVAERLLFDGKSVSCTPVRCQDRPNREQLCRLNDRYSSWLPMSIHLSHHINDEVCLYSDQKANMTDHKADQSLVNQADRGLQYTVPASETFSVLTSLLKNLEIAARDKDIHQIVDLITTDDIHPQLLPLVIALRRLTRKANVLRSNSTHLSKIGHYDLDLDSYTWASSPIRRYLDVIVQRILHSILEKTEVKYTTRDIDRACMEFSQKYAKQSAYEKKAYCLNLASQLSNQSARKVAYIVDFSPAAKGFRVGFPLLRTSLSEELSIMYRDLQITDQPEYDELSNCTILKWIRRVYSFTNNCIQSELEQQGPSSFITPVLTDAWKCLLSALREENWNAVFEALQSITSSVYHSQPERSHRGDLAGASKLGKSHPKEGHYVELSLLVKPGETLEVQLGTGTDRGLLVPTVQLLIVRPKFEICLEHTKNPIACFSKYALRSSKNAYATYMDYQKTWRPLCEMESATSAVAENESIVLEDVALTLKREEQCLQGLFCLPLENKKQWALECDFRNCFLCIRMRGHDNSLSSTDLTDRYTHRDAQQFDLTDVPTVIWIAHGVTTDVTDLAEAKNLSYMQIYFRINHMSMANIPEKVFRENTRFTVELIPKLLPDVRKEDAVSNLTQANQLVKDIATGKRTHRESIKAMGWKHSRFEIEDNLFLGSLPLNDSQNTAIREALNNQFTLIQGPPGTGKTVVGVHIVYWFFKQNQRAPTPKKQKDGDQPPKKRCILYCGPSNKSVDVVAAQLLKLRVVLKPLRVYSEQMEMREFPYPGSTLRLARRSVREEKPNKDISSITLHHLLRKPDNPYSTRILAFDARIKRGEELTDKEIESYKSILQAARKHELLQHDVILCTCTAAPNPNFAGTVNLQQIIIDECAMATEPEALIPLVTHKPEQIVLLGDHKQLQPIVHCDLVQRLGMSRSLFERYMEKALMLDTQYRMHEGICEFPSVEFYGGKLKTGARRRPSLLLTHSQKPTPIIFGHVEGKEVSLVVSTERGNENSVANEQEAVETVRLARLLTESGIEAEGIAILTPYNAQVAKINDTLARNSIQKVTVSTITKSQGSEWRYVILSTVRSCPESEIEMKPTKAWLLKRLGFLTDPNQVNVGITRAQEGLCIIGNGTLLKCSFLWRKLLSHYQDKDCVVDPARSIQVQRPKTDKGRRKSLLRKR